MVPKGWFNIYRGDEEYWSAQLWKYLGPTYLACLVVIAACILIRRRSQSPTAERFPHAYAAIWLVLVMQNVLAQLVTGPWSRWREVAFSIYYVLLFFITTVLVIHFRFVKTKYTSPPSQT